MIRASTKIKTPINTRFLGVPYIHLDSKLNILSNLLGLSRDFD